MKRHELDWFSLVAGAVFLVVAVTHLVSAASDERPDLGWLVPALLVGVGLAGVAGALRGVRPERTAPLAADQGGTDRGDSDRGDSDRSDRDRSDSDRRDTDRTDTELLHLRADDER